MPAARPARRPRPPSPTATPAPTAPPPATLTGYRWPLPRGRLTLPFGPSPWGSRIVDGRAVPRRRRPRDVLRRPDRRGPCRHGPRRRPQLRRSSWAGSATSQPYLDRLEKKHLWSTLPIVVVIDDGNGYRSIYAHFGKVVVKKGQTVKAGQLLGYEGRTGRASGCHLHYGLFSPAEIATFGIDPTVVEADEGAGPADRPDRPDARPRRAAQAAEAGGVRQRPDRPGAAGSARQRRR